MQFMYSSVRLERVNRQAMTKEKAAKAARAQISARRKYPGLATATGTPKRSAAVATEMPMEARDKNVLPRIFPSTMAGKPAGRYDMQDVLGN